MTPRHPLLVAVALTVAASAAGLGLGHRLGSSELGKALQVAGVTLIFGGLLGGVLKLLLADFALQRERREERAMFITNMLGDLKAVFDRVDRARTVISAHRSARTYGEEMRDLIDARVTLRNVDRALHLSVDGVRADTRKAVRKKVRKMKAYLTGLTDEFRNKYKPLSEHQRIYEARVRNALKSPSEKTGRDQVFPEEHEVWQSMLKLEKLSEFLGDEANRSPVYESEFEKPLDKASKKLRDELRALLAGREAG